MAHIGREYKRFFRRDLSLKPGGYCYLPESWEWSGIIHHPGAYEWFSNRRNKLDFIGYEENGNLLRWECRVPIIGVPNYHAATYYYRLTHDANMVQQWWVIGFAINPTSWTPKVYVNSSFPNNQLPGTWTDSNTGSWWFISLGQFKPWPW